MPDGRALCALSHGDEGWLMWMDVSNGVSYGSRNPAYDGPEEDVIDHVLSNGQRDEYPGSWALPVETVERALKHFRQTGERAPFVEWQAD